MLRVAVLYCSFSVSLALCLLISSSSLPPFPSRRMDVTKSLLLLCSSHPLSLSHCLLFLLPPILFLLLFHSALCFPFTFFSRHMGVRRSLHLLCFIPLALLFMACPNPTLIRRENQKKLENKRVNRRQEREKSRGRREDFVACKFVIFSLNSRSHPRIHCSPSHLFCPSLSHQSSLSTSLFPSCCFCCCFRFVIFSLRSASLSHPMMSSVRSAMLLPSMKGKRERVRREAREKA